MRDLQAARNELAAANQQPITPTTIEQRQQAVSALDAATLEAIAADSQLRTLADARREMREMVENGIKTPSQRAKLDALYVEINDIMNAAITKRDATEALIDELARALKDALDTIQTAKRYFPKSIRNRDCFSLLNCEANSIRPALRHATSHQEARRGR